MDFKKLSSDLKAFLESQGNTEVKIEYINALREIIHEYSPFKNEPVKKESIQLSLV